METLIKNYFREEIIFDRNKDKFGHIEIANEIRDIIICNGTKENSLAIGVFGKWGVGKSSVIKLLKEEVLKESSGLKYIDIPIWKYTNAKSIRRKFIYEISYCLDKDSEIINLYNTISEEAAISVFDKLFQMLINFSKSFERVLGLLYIFMISAMIIYIFITEAFVANAIKIITAATLLGIITLILEVLKTIKNTKHTVIKEPFESEEQFEHKAEEILQDENVKKIIVIDDLDRCDKNKILGTFEVIRNFLEIKNCVFIIACDPDIIRKAVEEIGAGITESKEASFYLDKIFQHTLNIPQFLSQNMREYSKQMIIDSNIELFKKKEIVEKLDEILYTLIYKDTINPRKAKSLLNSFILNYKLTEKLEINTNSYLNIGYLTGNPEFIAFVSVIKSEFPSAIEFLRYAPMNDLLSYTKTEAMSEVDRKKIVDKSHELYSFITYCDYNKHLLSQKWDISAYINQNIDPSINLIPDSYRVNYYEIVDSLLSGDSIRFNKIVGEIENSDISIIEFILKQIDIRNNKIERNNIIAVLISTIAILDVNSIWNRLPKEFNELIISSLISIQIPNPVIFHPIDESLITYNAYLLLNDKPNGEYLFDTINRSSLSNRLSHLHLYFNSKYFLFFDNSIGNKILELINKSNSNPELYNLYQKVKIDDKNWIYFKQFYEETKESFEFEGKIELDLPEENDKLYFELCNSVAQFSFNYFITILSDKISFTDFYNKFSDKFFEFDSKYYSILFNKLIKIKEEQDEKILNKDFLDWLEMLVIKREDLGSIEYDNFLANAVNLELDGYLDKQILNSLKNILGILKKKTKKKFIEFYNVLFNVLDSESFIEESNIIVEWLSDEKIVEFDCSDKYIEYLGLLLGSPTSFKNIGKSDIKLKYAANYLGLLENNILKSSIDIPNELLTIYKDSIFHISNYKNYTLDYFQFVFEKMAHLDSKNQLNKGSSFKSLYLELIKNQVNYSDKIIESIVFNLLNDKNSYYLKSTSGEVLALTKIIETRAEDKNLVRLAFIFRCNYCNSWWPISDTEFISKNPSIYELNIPKWQLDKLINESKNRFYNILSPKDWDEGKNWEDCLPGVLNNISILLKHQSNDVDVLLDKLYYALQYYYNISGKEQILKKIYLFMLLPELSNNSLPMKNKYSQQIRDISSKYKRLRPLGKEVAKKFDLKIANKYFD